MNYNISIKETIFQISDSHFGTPFAYKVSTSANDGVLALKTNI